MKRRFAVPAAIALTAHALLFMGSGKPPIAPAAASDVLRPVDTKPPEEETILLKAIEFSKNELAEMSKSSEKSGGGDRIDTVPHIPEIPRPDGPRDLVEFTQERVAVNYDGHGTKITGLRVPGGEGDGSGLGDAAVSVRLLDNPPRTRFQKEPLYPGSLKSSGITGTVWVEFMVDETGHVHEARVLKSTHAGFEGATLAAVSMWRFEPGKRKGAPVSFRMSLPVVFNLTN